MPVCLFNPKGGKNGLLRLGGKFFEFISGWKIDRGGWKKKVNLCVSPSWSFTLGSLRHIHGNANSI
jgi:hypothetical protein